MGWKRGYYYSGGRYVGNDWLARVNAAMDADHAAIKQEMREIAWERRQFHQEAYQEARQRAAKVDLIVTKGLEAAGFYRQVRHQWRRRKATMNKLETNAPGDPPRGRRNERRDDWPHVGQGRQGIDGPLGVD